MPQYELIGCPQIRVRANRFRIGDPNPSGSRPLTAAEAMSLANGYKFLALMLMARTFLVPDMLCSEYPKFWLLNYGDWYVRMRNGNMVVVTDEQFHRQFRPVEGKPCSHKPS